MTQQFSTYRSFFGQLLPHARAHDFNSHLHLICAPAVNLVAIVGSPFASLYITFGAAPHCQICSELCVFVTYIVSSKNHEDSLITGLAVISLYRLRMN